jgi:hypothetical protein
MQARLALSHRRESLQKLPCAQGQQLFCELFSQCGSIFGQASLRRAQNLRAI